MRCVRVNADGRPDFSEGIPIAELGIVEARAHLLLGSIVSFVAL
jgi:hypothetical protein